MIKLCGFADEAASDLQEQIAALKRNGISLLELRTIAGKNIADFSDQEAENYQKILKENGISVWSIGSPLGKSDISEDEAVYQKRVHRLCRLAQIFEAKRIRAFSFFQAFENKQEVFSRLQKTVDIAREYGVQICHENEKEIYGDTLERVREIMQNVQGLRYIYDPANFLQCGEKAENTLAALFDTTEYFHIKDVIFATGELVPAGLGDGKIGEIVEKIGDNDKVLTLEPHLAVFAGYAQIDNTKMKNKFAYATGGEAFDAAVRALKNILKEKGYKQVNGGFEK